MKWFAIFLGWLLFPGVVSAAPSISNVSDSGQTGKYEKFEVTASLNTSAGNMFFPYDTTPVAGLTPGLGVSVDGLFTPDNWSTVYKQPGFYFVEYSENGSLYYPTGNTFWKIRFAPDRVGNWQYKISVKDAGGTIESQPRSFVVVESNNHGFIQVSKNDHRYFEFSDGTYFPGMGLNDSLDKNDPENNVAKFVRSKTNGIQVFRYWLSHTAIFGSSWTPWESITGTYDGYLPRAGLITNRAESTTASPQANLTIVYSEDANGQNSGSWFSACHLSVAGGGQVKIATKPNTPYRFRIRYQAKGLTGPRDARFPGWGFVLKRQNPNNGNWHGFQNPGGECWNGSANNADTGVKISGYAHDTAGWTNNNGWSSPTWEYLEADWQSIGDYTPILYLALENVNPLAATVNGLPYNWRPYVYIDTIELREKKTDGSLGPNIIPRWSFSFLEQIDQRNAYAFDKNLKLAEDNGVYLKTVILEKNEQIENEIGADGNRANSNNNNLYGNWRNLTAVRWYQQAWWRYLQARWGYSTAIHSWELVNEGEPVNSQHWTATDELAKFMKCGVFGITVGSVDGSKCSYSHPNAHLSTTSFWYGFPGTDFWANSKYPNVDYADVHDYINKPSEPQNYYDTALATYNLGASTTGIGKPVIRGETGLITDNGTDMTSQELDANGVWLHNFIWGGINPTGLTENWWHLAQIKSNHYPYYKHYYDFVNNIPLNKGGYVDAGVTATDTNVRVWGQKNTARNLAHIWVQNKKHIWCAVNNTAGCPQPAWDSSRLNGTVTIIGFAPGNYSVEYWSFDNNVVLTKTAGTATVDGAGNLILNLATLPSTVTDVGIKIGNYNLISIAGDLNGDGKVDILDLRLAIKNFGNIFDLTTVLANYGR